MGDGKKILMPCGHMGECTFGNFAICPVEGCDGTGEDFKNEPTLPDLLNCPNVLCKSEDTEPFAHTTIPGLWHCVTCGTCFKP